MNPKKKGKYVAEFNKKALLIPIITTILGAFLLFYEKLAIQFRIFGGILFMAGIIGFLGIAAAYVNVKATAIILEQINAKKKEEDTSARE